RRCRRGKAVFDRIRARGVARRIRRSLEARRRAEVVAQHLNLRSGQRNVVLPASRCRRGTTMTECGYTEDGGADHECDHECDRDRWTAPNGRPIGHDDPFEDPLLIVVVDERVRGGEQRAAGVCQTFDWVTSAHQRASLSAAAWWGAARAREPARAAVARDAG